MSLVCPEYQEHVDEPDVNEDGPFFEVICPHCGWTAPSDRSSYRDTFEAQHAVRQ